MKRIVSRILLVKWAELAGLNLTRLQIFLRQKDNFGTGSSFKNFYTKINDEQDLGRQGHPFRKDVYLHDGVSQI